MVCPNKVGGIPYCLRNGFGVSATNSLFPVANADDASGLGDTANLLVAQIALVALKAFNFCVIR